MHRTRPLLIGLACFCLAALPAEDGEPPREVIAADQALVHAMSTLLLAIEEKDLDRLMRHVARVTGAATDEERAALREELADRLEPMREFLLDGRACIWREFSRRSGDAGLVIADFTANDAPTQPEVTAVYLLRQGGEWMAFPPGASTWRDHEEEFSPTLRADFRALEEWHEAREERITALISSMRRNADLDLLVPPPERIPSDAEVQDLVEMVFVTKDLERLREHYAEHVWKFRGQEDGRQSLESNISGSDFELIRVDRLTADNYIEMLTGYATEFTDSHGRYLRLAEDELDCEHLAERWPNLPRVLATGEILGVVLDVDGQHMPIFLGVIATPDGLRITLADDK